MNRFINELISIRELIRALMVAPTLDIFILIIDSIELTEERDNVRSVLFYTIQCLQLI